MEPLPWLSWLKTIFDSTWKNIFNDFLNDSIFIPNSMSEKEWEAL